MVEVRGQRVTPIGPVMSIHVRLCPFMSTPIGPFSSCVRDKVLGVGGHVNERVVMEVRGQRPVDVLRHHLHHRLSHHVHIEFYTDGRVYITSGFSTTHVRITP